ncbi:MAG: hypothetical protein AB7O96_06090 [Pseudobdellovibrionaceae bacterium]
MKFPLTSSKLMTHLIPGVFIFFTGVATSQAEGLRCAKLYPPRISGLTLREKKFRPSEGITNPDFNKALFEILTPFQDGKIDRKTAEQELYRLSQDPRAARSLRLEDFENLSDNDLKSVYVFARAELNRFLHESGLSLHDRPNSFKKFIGELNPKLRVRHSTDLDILVEVLAKLKIETARVVKNDDSEVGAFVYAALQDPMFSKNDHYFGDSPFIIWADIGLLDHNKWHHANGGFHYGRQSPHSFAPDYSMALYIEHIGNGTRGNEVMFPDGINYQNIPFRIQAPTEADRKALLGKLRSRSIPAPNGQKWEDLVSLPISQ